MLRDFSEAAVSLYEFVHNSTERYR